MYLPNEVHANKLTPCSELMIFIGYKDNGYRFICHIQGNVIFHSTQAIFDEGHFPKCPSSRPREQMPPGRLTPEIESSVPGPFGIDEPAPIPFITNGHLLICDWCFRILKDSKMRSLDSDKRCC